jgi:hypothetical protein
VRADYAALRADAIDWARRAAAAGWVSPDAAARVAMVEGGQPQDLFVETAARPLVVAFFGGTGVGKSSLLNRLAGAALARTGVERPTSREVTIYAHESLRLAELPAEMPVQSVRTHRHDLAHFRDVLWIDAPDIDSVEDQNRRLALAWLPHIDLLIYVVSPERYRDDVGWRVLRQREGRHGWMFVLNRWDEGAAAQREQFAAMLREAGFAAPLLFCTSCATGERRLPGPDEFDAITTTIRELLDQHAVTELERLGTAARCRELADCVAAAAAQIPDDARWSQISAELERVWHESAGVLDAGLAFPLRAVAGRFARRSGGVAAPLTQVLGLGLRAKPHGESAQEAAPHDLSELLRGVWDEWAQEKLRDAARRLEVAATGRGCSIMPLERHFEAALADTGEQIRRGLMDAVRMALSRAEYGPRWWLARALGVLTLLLPLAALGWVGYEVVTGFARAARGAAPFFDTRFLVHSALLVCVSWLTPLLLSRLARPSLERVVATTLRSALAVELDRVAQRLAGALADADRERGELAAQSAALLARLNSHARPRLAAAGALARAVATP